jgi:tetratricopeptide (TPR) repeat protein
MCERNFAEARRATALLAQDKPLSANFPPSLWETYIAHFDGDEKKARSSYVVTRRIYEKFLRERGDYPEAFASLALLDATFGRKDDALREIRKAVDLMPVSKDPLNGAEFVAGLAAVYGLIGDRDRAFEQLRAFVKMAPQPDCSYGVLKLSPMWDSLRGDPRFAQILAEAAKPIPIQ